MFDNPWDLANGFFEGVGSVLTWLNVRRLYIDKTVKGVQWEVTVFWTAWGIFNLFFYGPVLGLWFSWWMGISIVIANAVWVGMVLYYRTAAEQLRKMEH